MKIRTAQRDRTAILWPRGGLIGHRLPELNPWKLGRLGELSCFQAAATYHDVCRVRNVDRYASVDISLDRIEERAVEPASKRISNLTLRKLGPTHPWGPARIRGVHQGASKKCRPVTDGVRP